MTYAEITVAARRVLLDALEALSESRAALVLAGAQAVYLYTGDADVAIATTTKDSDLVVVPARLPSAPKLEAALTSAGFTHDSAVQQPGEWTARDPLAPPIELLVPASLSGPGGRRGARIPPHSKYAARTVPGLEAAAVSYLPTTIESLDPEVDSRRTEMNVASPAALMIAKSFKLGERARDTPGRLLPKDAHDVYRLLRAVPAASVAEEHRRLRASPVAGDVTAQSLTWLADLSADSASLIPELAGRAEALAGDPVEVAQSTWALIHDVLDRI